MNQIFTKLLACWIAFVLIPIITSGQNVFDNNEKIISKTITQRWELDSASKKGTFRLTSYKPFYITAGRYSTNPNNQPYSENPNYSSPTQSEYNNYEAKFQLSFKTKILQDMFWGKADLWLGYTQRAHWQIYNTNLSRPFRELNYEPELLLNIPVSYQFLGFRGRTLGLAANHQSNGKDLPTSRSWNRIIFHAGLENDRWAIVLRPWIRISDEDDENPLIMDFIGRGEATVVYNMGKHQLYALATNSLRFGGELPNRGSLQLNYVFPVRANLRGHIQFFDGYGETLIDYNHRQTTIGLGVSFIDW